MMHPKFLRLRKSLVYHLLSLLCRQLLVINNLACYLCALLTPSIPTAHYMKDLFTIIKDIQEVSMQDSFMVSCHVCSLFTSIPLSETIDIAVKLILENKTDLKMN